MTRLLALGELLVVGFALHNTTEGLAIVAPVAAARPSLGRLVVLGLIAGAPTVLGAWIGAAEYTASLAAFLFGFGAGAIAQVVVQLAPTLRDRSPVEGLRRRRLGPLEVFAQSVSGAAPSAAMAATPVIVAVSAGNATVVSFLAAMLLMLLVAAGAIAWVADALIRRSRLARGMPSPPLPGVYSKAQVVAAKPAAEKE